MRRMVEYFNWYIFGIFADDVPSDEIKAAFQQLIYWNDAVLTKIINANCDDITYACFESFPQRSQEMLRNINMEISMCRAIVDHSPNCVRCMGIIENDKASIRQLACSHCAYFFSKEICYLAKQLRTPWANEQLKHED